MHFILKLQKSLYPVFKGTARRRRRNARTHARYRYFTVIEVTTRARVVNHCILSGQTPQDAVGGQFDILYIRRW